jgi:acetolactate synthase-1/2/3 large subunit
VESVDRDYIAEFIAGLGVKHVFMISGGGNMHLVDSVSRREDFEYICTHHEQSAAIAAEAYGRESGNIGVCIVTTGPAGTNCFTGVAGAWLDSIPALYISGQVKRETIARQPGLRQLGVQEAPIVDMVKPITKYAVLIEEPELIRYHLEKAVFLAKNGRPGPVWLDIPSDVQGAFIDPTTLKSFDANAEGIIAKPQNTLSPELLETISNLLKL